MHCFVCVYHIYSPLTLDQPLTLTLILTLPSLCPGLAGSAGTTFGYKAVRGDEFVMQCASPCSAKLYNAGASASQGIVWSKLDEDGQPRGLEDTGGMSKRGNALWFSAVEEKHSGRYVCQMG